MISPHFAARIRLRRPSEGGRKTGADLRLYRPDIPFQVEDEPVFFGAHFSPDAGWLEPGETKELDIQIRNVASAFMAHVARGTKFLLVEGPKAVADGEVTVVYRIDD